MPVDPGAAELDLGAGPVGAPGPSAEPLAPLEQHGLASAQRALARRRDAREPPAHDHHVVHQLLTRSQIARQPRPRPGQADPRAPGCTRPPPSERSSSSAAEVRGEPRRGREIDGCSPPRPPSSSGAPRSERSADSIRPASAGSGTIATSSSSSVQIPPSAEHQRGHDRIGADGDHQLDAGWGHPLGEHTAVVRGRQFGQPAVGGPHLVGRVQPERDATELGLVLHAGRAQLQRHVPAQLVERRHGVVLAGHDSPAGHRDSMLPAAAPWPRARPATGRRRARTRSGRSAAIARKRSGSAVVARALGGAANPGAQPGRGGDAGVSELPRGLVVEQLGQGRGDERRDRAARGAGDDALADRAPGLLGGAGQAVAAGRRRRARRRSPDPRRAL